MLRRCDVADSDAYVDLACLPSFLTLRVLLSARKLSGYAHATCTTVRCGH